MVLDGIDVQIKNIRNRCPCCGSSDGRFLYELGYGSVYECDGCKVAYTVFSGPSASKTNEKFNALDFLKTRLYDQYELRNIARKRLFFLSRFISGEDVLEFGSSTGEFLYEAAKKGYKVSSVDMYSTVLNINKTKNLQEISRSDASHFAAKHVYDAIAAFHVVEHLTDPGRFLQNCNKALKPGGVLFLEVPNFDSLARRCFGKKSGTFYDYHVCHFGKDSLRYLISRCGYEIITFRTVDDPVRYIAPVYNPLRHGLWSMIKKLVSIGGYGHTQNDMRYDTATGYSKRDEIRILNSNKARIYRFETGFIRTLSKVLLPICALLNSCYLGSDLQVVARSTSSER